MKVFHNGHGSSNIHSHHYVVIWQHIVRCSNQLDKLKSRIMIPNKKKNYKWCKMMEVKIVVLITVLMIILQRSTILSSLYYFIMVHNSFSRRMMQNQQLKQLHSHYQRKMHKLYFQSLFMIWFHRNSGISRKTSIRFNYSITQVYLIHTIANSILNIEKQAIWRFFLIVSSQHFQHSIKIILLALLMVLILTS